MTLYTLTKTFATSVVRICNLLPQVILQIFHYGLAVLWGTWHECSRVLYGREWLHMCNSIDKGLCQRNNSIFAVLEEFTPPPSGGPQVPFAPFPWHVAMAVAVTDLFANVWKKITRTTSFFAMYYITAIPTPAIPTFLYIHYGQCVPYKYIYSNMRKPLRV